jgi:hypothetical protein
MRQGVRVKTPLAAIWHERSLTPSPCLGIRIRIDDGDAEAPISVRDAGDKQGHTHVLLLLVGWWLSGCLNPTIYGVLPRDHDN